MSSTADTTRFESKGATVEVRPDGVDLDWEFWDAQLDVIDAIYSGDYDVVCFRGGYGSGKTVLGARLVIEVALSITESHCLVMGQDFKKAGVTTYNVFFEQLPGENTVPDEGGDPENSPIIADYNRNDKRLTVINGSVIRLGSADKWNRYAGAEFNIVWKDEPAHYDNTDIYKLNEMIVSRQRTEEGPNVSLWTSTGNGFNDFYDFTERQVTNDGDPLPTRIKNVVADSRNNPFLPEKEKLTRQFADTVREDEALAGGFAAAEGLVYSTFSREHHIVPEATVSERITDADPIYGYDAGWGHARVLIEWQPTHYDQWLATDCYYETETSFEHLCDPSDGSGWVYEEDKPRSKLYAEHEPEHIQKFNRAGFGAVQAEKSLDEGIPFMRGLLETKGDPERPGLLVSDRCVELIQEFQSYKEEHVGKSGDVPDHCLDASRYALFTHANQPTIKRTRRMR